MKALARRALLVAAAMALGGCLSPTLPLPPPDKPVISAPDEAGYVRLQGTTKPSADVFAHNNSTGFIDGQRTAGDGKYDFKVLAQSGDAITFWYKSGLQDSPSIIFRIP